MTALLKVTDVATHLAVPPGRVRLLIRRGDLHAINVGTPRRPEWRVEPTAITKFKQARTNTPTYT